MKVYMQPIKMISWSDEKGIITPMKFQIKGQGGERTTIKVDQVVTRDEEKLAGNRMLLYKCLSLIDDVQRIFELKYEVSTCKWYLYKI